MVGQSIPVSLVYHYFALIILNSCCLNLPKPPFIEISTHCVIKYFMGIITKKIRNGTYAYLAVREGRKVIHKYLGSVHDPLVARIIRDNKEASSIPEWLQYLFWDTSLNKIHMKRNARYIIERVLEFGDMNALGWLQKIYPAQIILNVLYVSRTITEKSRNFWMLWYGVDDA